MFMNGQYDTFGGPDHAYLNSLLAPYQGPPVTTSQPGFAPTPSPIQLPTPPVMLGGGESGMGGSGNEWGLTGGTFLSNFMNPSTGGDVQQGGGGGFGSFLGGFGGGGAGGTGGATTAPSSGAISV